MTGAMADGTVTLRPLEAADAAAHLAGEDEEQIRWVSGGPGTPESVSAWIERGRRSREEGGPIHSFGIVAAGELVGMVEANTDHTRISGIAAGEANISYAVYPVARQRGYATRAVNLVTAYVAQRGITAAVIRVHPDNATSLRVAARCGFVRDGLAHRADGQTWLVFRKLLERG